MHNNEDNWKEMFAEDGILSSTERKSQNQRRVKEIMKEQQERGLKTAISKENIGFMLLKKLGYAPEKGLGKNESGILEPLEVSVRPNREGLGREEIRRSEELRKREFIENQKKVRAEMIDSFRDVQGKKTQAQKLYRKITSATKVLENLLYSHEISLDDVPLLAKSQDMLSLNSNSWTDDDYYQHLSLLVDIIHDLRSRFSYCMYCCCAYKDQDELSALCPGINEEDHD